MLLERNQTQLFTEGDIIAILKGVCSALVYL